MNKIKEVLSSNRFKSFYWRLGMMIVATVVAFLSEAVVDFGWSAEITILVGLVLGEISKALNSK